MNHLPADGSIIYCKEDPEVVIVCTNAPSGVNQLPYGIPSHEIVDGITYLTHDGQRISLQIFGNHNLMNLEGARLVCNQIGVNDEQFYQAISTFKGAARRLELVVKNDHVTIFKDFAHSPSKLKATTQAVKEQFGNRKVIACMELHTFSSLNANFLDEYAGAMDAADTAIVFFNPHTIAHKKLAAISADQVKQAFKRSDLLVFDDSKTLENYLKNLNFKNDVLLMMSSGTFDGMDLKAFGY